ncbi:DUF305 domain-containing protein [Cupriavidus sp. NPDC089707]|uniref:DUF305 domain-containing protein n=1 Tax=Cupriavidus sp. NPDC089707 TaxID=3363963 RepID=UPI003829219D
MKPPLPAFMLAAIAAAAASICLAGGVPAVSHDHGHPPLARQTGPFVASTAKPFAQRMDDAMAVMDAGMRAAAMNGDPDHDFVAMMIPHHQGAIDMAKALLLDTRDPELRNLAQGIITDQQNEIRLMQAWLARHPKAAPSRNPAPADSH